MYSLWHLLLIFYIPERGASDVPLTSQGLVVNNLSSWNSIVHYIGILTHERHVFEVDVSKLFMEGRTCVDGAWFDAK